MRKEDEDDICLIGEKSKGSFGYSFKIIFCSKK